MEELRGKTCSTWNGQRMKTLMDKIGCRIVWLTHAFAGKVID